jgi:RNase P subunit RPR2
MALSGGVGAIIMGLLPTKFQQKYCPNCKVVTNQFKAKQKIETTPTIGKRGTDRIEYVCESCGNTTVEIV